MEYKTKALGAILTGVAITTPIFWKNADYVHKKLLGTQFSTFETLENICSSCALETTPSNLTETLTVLAVTGLVLAYHKIGIPLTKKIGNIYGVQLED